jgi:hypothetical protein
MTRNTYSAAMRCALRRRLSHSLSLTLPLAFGATMLAASPFCIAQIPQSNGSSQQDNRTAAMGSTPDQAASTVHESHKPQSKDSGSGNVRGKTAGKNHKSEGAGGFDNGLYGTGAGSNK